MIGDLGVGEISVWLTRFSVIAMRTSAMMFFLPILGARLLPVRIRLVIAAVLAVTFLSLPQIAAVNLDSLGDWILVGIRELAIGFVFGLGARVTFTAVEMAAGFVAGQSGFALASMVDPASGDQSLATTLFQTMLATSLFLAADLHHMFIRGIGRSFELLPPAAAFPNLDGMGHQIAQLGMGMFDVAITLAAPALIVTLALDLVMVLVGKAMPQAPIFMIAYPLKMAAGLVAMWVLAVATGSAIGWLGRTMMQDGALLLQMFAKPS